ncbi:MAG: branched-chain amino acid ABC transporter substrate-binding protein [Acidimicrobiales bacterium]
MLVVAVSLLGAACGSSTKTAGTTGTTLLPSPIGSDSVTCPAGIKIGFFGALTGANAQLGLNEAQAEQVAITAFNESHAKCQIGYQGFDSQGDPSQAPALATQASGESSVVALIGPAFSGESEAADPIFTQAGLPTITVSATNPDLATHSWSIFHRAVANDNAQGPADAMFIANTLHAKKVAVIDDASSYGKGLADIVRSTLSSSGVQVYNPGSIDMSNNYPSTVNLVKAANVDAVFFGGYYAQAGPLALQLKNGGVTAPFISGDGSLDAHFVSGAGAAADGSYLSAPAAYALTDPADAAFVAAYTKKWSMAPALYSGEGFDATNELLSAIAAGNVTRSAINTYIGSHSYVGLLKTYAYAASGELKGSPIIIVHKVVNNQITVFAKA